MAPAWTRAVQCARVDIDPAHRRQVDHETAIARGETGDVVRASTYCDNEIVGAREAEALKDVRHAAAAGDGSRPPVDHAVPDAARFVVPGGIWQDETLAEPRGERLERGARQRLVGA